MSSSDICGYGLAARCEGSSARASYAHGGSATITRNAAFGQRRRLGGDRVGPAADHQIAMSAADLAGAADGVEQPAMRLRIDRRRVGDVGCHVGDAGGLPQADAAHHGETAAGRYARWPSAPTVLLNFGNSRS